VEDALPRVTVALLEGDDLAPAQSGVAAEEHERLDAGNIATIRSVVLSTRLSPLTFLRVWARSSASAMARATARSCAATMRSSPPTSA
jgi:hypothetical protein